MAMHLKAIRTILFLVTYFLSGSGTYQIFAMRELETSC